MDGDRIGSGIGPAFARCALLKGALSQLRRPGHDDARHRSVDVGAPGALRVAPLALLVGLDASPKQHTVLQPRSIGEAIDMSRVESTGLTLNLAGEEYEGVARVMEMNPLDGQEDCVAEEEKPFVRESDWREIPATISRPLFPVGEASAASVPGC